MTAALTDGQYYFVIVMFLGSAALALWTVAGYIGARLRFPPPRRYHTSSRVIREAESIIRQEENHDH